MVGWSAASPPQGVGGVEEEEEFLYFFVQSETQRNGPKFDLKECGLFRLPDFSRGAPSLGGLVSGQTPCLFLKKTSQNQNPKFIISASC